MTTIILAVIVGILVLDRLFSFRVSKFDYDYLNGKANDLRKQYHDLNNGLHGKFESIREHLKSHADSGDEHFRAFQELADQLGYCVHEEGVVSTTFSDLMKGNYKSETRLCVHKKETVTSKNIGRTLSKVKRAIKRRI